MLSLHVAVLLFGLAGLFGKLLPLSPLLIVTGRTFFAAMALGLFMAAGRRRLVPQDKRVAGLLALPGVILALHWWTFFHAIQISTVAIGLLGFAAFPMFVTLLEPAAFQEPLRGFDLLTALAVSAGLVAVAWPLELQSSRTAGALWGMLSGFLFAVLSLLNRKFVRRHGSVRMAWFQNTAACLLLAPFAWSTAVRTVTWPQILMLLALGLFCTALAHGLFIHSMTVVRAQLAGVMAALEPVYGIIFAFLLLGEVPAGPTLAGGALIVGTSIIAMYYRRKPSETKAPSRQS
jgi:drug/metabolite transporter (DMT)-like permease